MHVRTQDVLGGYKGRCVAKDNTNCNISDSNSSNSSSSNKDSINTSSLLDLLNPQASSQILGVLVPLVLTGVRRSSSSSRKFKKRAVHDIIGRQQKRGNSLDAVHSDP